MEDLVFGLQVTVVGMGIVFGLLALLWALLTLALRLERRRGAEGAGDTATAAAGGAGGATAAGSVEAPPAGGAPGGSVRLAGAPDGLDPRLVAAIGVVILRHAETRRRQAAPAMRSYWPGSLLFASRWVAAGRMRQGQTWRRRPR